MTRKNILRFLEREKCKVIDNDLIDYAIDLSQGIGDFNIYDRMLHAKAFMHNDDYLYYNIGLVALYGLDAYGNDEEDIDFFRILVEDEQNQPSLSESDVADAIVEMIKNNSDVGGNDDDSLMMTGVDYVWLFNSNTICVNMEDGSTYTIKVYKQ